MLPENTDPTSARLDLAHALGVSLEDLDRELGRYRPPSLAVAGPGCPSDLQWATLRQTQTAPSDISLRAHLASCRRCRQRAQNILGLYEGARLEEEEYPHELLCLSEEQIMLSARRPDMLDAAAKKHLEFCGTCKADSDRLRL
jgi:hypothetical protein